MLCDTEYHEKKAGGRKHVELDSIISGTCSYCRSFGIWRVGFGSHPDRSHSFLDFHRPAAHIDLNAFFETSLTPYQTNGGVVPVVRFYGLKGDRGIDIMAQN